VTESTPFHAQNRSSERADRDQSFDADTARAAITDNSGPAKGVHLIVEVHEGHGLDDETRVAQAFRDCVTACGATLLHLYTHRFSPHGISGVAVLAESHISAHTWPEIGYGAFDVFMCGQADPWPAVEVLKAAFETEQVQVRALPRGP